MNGLMGFVGVDKCNIGFNYRGRYNTYHYPDEPISSMKNDDIINKLVAMTKDVDYAYEEIAEDYYNPETNEKGIKLHKTKNKIVTGFGFSGVNNQEFIDFIFDNVYCELYISFEVTYPTTKIVRKKEVVTDCKHKIKFTVFTDEWVDFHIGMKNIQYSEKPDFAHCQLFIDGKPDFTDKNALKDFTEYVKRCTETNKDDMAEHIAIILYV